MKMIGREAEMKLLNQIVDSDKAEFVTVYGRRRIGKTFLVREFFNDKLSFYATGLANANTCLQHHLRKVLITSRPRF
jgi:uncharacterized protein